MGPEGDQRGGPESLRTGVRIYAVAGVVFLLVFVWLESGPWKWLGGSIGAVCLLRALYYWLCLRWKDRPVAGSESTPRGTP